MASCDYCDAIAWSGERCGTHWDKGKPATLQPPDMGELIAKELRQCEENGVADNALIRTSDGGYWRYCADSKSWHSVQAPWVALQARIDAAVARRKAKRESIAPQSPDDHPWARAGHTHANWSTDACPKCLLTGQEVKELGYYPKCDDYKRECEERAKIARAMSTPLPHDPDIRTRLMPWRGKE